MKINRKTFLKSLPVLGLGGFLPISLLGSAKETKIVKQDKYVFSKPVNAYIGIQSAPKDKFVFLDQNPLGTNYNKKYSKWHGNIKSLEELYRSCDEFFTNSCNRGGFNEAISLRGYIALITEDDISNFGTECNVTGPFGLFGPVWWGIRNKTSFLLNCILTGWHTQENGTKWSLREICNDLGLPRIVEDKIV